MDEKRVVAALLMICGFLVVSPSPAWAQSGIAGVVKDSTGGVLPGVTVEATSDALIEKVRVGHHGRPGAVPHHRPAPRPVCRHVHPGGLQHRPARRHSSFRPRSPRR